MKPFALSPRYTLRFQNFGKFGILQSVYKPRKYLKNNRKKTKPFPLLKRKKSKTTKKTTAMKATATATKDQTSPMAISSKILELTNLTQYSTKEVFTVGDSSKKHTAVKAFAIAARVYGKKGEAQVNLSLSVGHKMGLATIGYEGVWYY